MKPALPRPLAALGSPGAAGWLLVVLLAAMAHAAFSDGGTGARDAMPWQVAIGASVVLGGVALAAGALDGSRSRIAWAGASLLVAYAAWTALSVAWSAAPDEGWLAANRAAGYAGAVAVALAIAPRIRSAPVAFSAAIAAIALAAAIWALLGRIFPEAEFGPFSFEGASELARLREPISYSNGLGGLMALAVPVCIWLAAARAVRPSLRLPAVIGLELLLVTMALTISRGAIAAALIAAAVMVAAGPDRLGRLLAMLAATAFALPAVLFAYSSDALSTDGVSAAERAGDGGLLGLCLAGSVLALAGVTRIALRIESRGGLGERGSRRVWRGLAVVAAVAAIVGVGTLATSDRGLTGTITGEWREFRSPDDVGEGPGRLLSAGGSNRWAWWREAGGAFVDKPVTGWGAGSFPVVHLLYRDVPGQVRSAHSVPLQWLVEGGAVGAGLVLAALTFLLVAAVTRIRRAAGVRHGARLALVAGFAAWSVQAAADWTWEIPALTIPALVGLAVAATPPARPPRRSDLVVNRPWRPPAAPLAAGAALVGAAAIALAALPAMSEERLGEADALAAGGQTRAALERAEEARRLNPLAIEPAILAATLYVRLDDTEAAERVLLEAATDHPDNASVWDRVWVLELLLGNPKVAREAFERSIRNDPLPAILGRRSIGETAWGTAVPPDESPTAAGTPPPGGGR